MKRFILYMTLLALSVMSSCKKFLSEEPSPQADIKTVAQLQALVDNVQTGPAFAIDADYYFAPYSSDDTQISEALYKGSSSSTFTPPVLSAYVFDINGIVNQTADALWNGEYKKIFTANVILSNIDGVTGNEADKNQVKADAYFIRAEANWVLANYYCQPYATANLSGLGLPLKKTTDYAEDLTRSTLQQTYDAILSDISQAESLVTYTDVPSTYRWRISKSGVEAFLSRYYLFTGDFAACIQHANNALQSTAVSLVDYNTIGPGTPTTYTNPSVTLNYCALNNYTAAQFIQWNEMYYDRFNQASTQFCIPSPALLSLYDQSNDLRYSLFMIPNGGRKFSIISPATYRYTVFQDGTYFVKGPGIAEILLNKAEASARLGDLATATSSVNQLRAKRYKTGSGYALSFASQADAVTQILHERRRELPFSFRFLDIRRFSVDNDATDDVTISKTFYSVNNGLIDTTVTKTYTLASPNLVMPINGSEIANSHGQIQQNIYK